MLSAPVVVDDQTIGTFRVAESLSQIDEAQESLRSAFLVMGAVALVILIGVAIWIATLISRPLVRMAGFAAEVEAGGLDRRLEIDEGPTEVRSLTDSLNRMLDRLQQAFDREREFVADASTGSALRSRLQAANSTSCAGTSRLPNVSASTSLAASYAGWSA